MAYIVKADIEKYLNITLNTNGQNLVDNLIPPVEEAVELYCNRDWKTTNGNTDITEIFDGGTNKFFLAKPPIKSVTSIKVGKTASYAGDLLVAGNDDYYVYDSYILLASSAVALPRSVEIIYRTNANLAAIPASIKQAIIQWVAEMFKAAPDAGKVAKDVQIATMKISFKTSPDDMPDYVRRVLDMYRLIPL